MKSIIKIIARNPPSNAIAIEGLLVLTGRFSESAGPKNWNILQSR